MALANEGEGAESELKRRIHVAAPNMPKLQQNPTSYYFLHVEMKQTPWLT